MKGISEGMIYKPGRQEKNKNLRFVLAFEVKEFGPSEKVKEGQMDLALVSEQGRQQNALENWA